MYGLANTGSGLDLVIIEYHQSVAERHPNFVVKFSYLKDLEDMDPFNISGVDRGKEGEQVKLVVDITAVITYKTPFVVNGKPGTVSPDLGEGATCNTIFSWPFLQTIKASIMTKNNDLVSGLLGEHFRLQIWFHKESRKHQNIRETSSFFASLNPMKTRKHEVQKQG